MASDKVCENFQWWGSNFLGPYYRYGGSPIWYFHTYGSSPRFKTCQRYHAAMNIIEHYLNFKLISNGGSKW